jgi:integrase
VVVAPRPPVPEVLHTYAEALRLFESLPIHRARWFWLAVWTGQRASDVERMTWSDVDLQAHTMLIRSTKTHRPEGLKVHIPEPLFRVLVEMHAETNPRQTDAIVRPWPSRKTTLPLHCQRCGLPRMNATALRHTNLSWIASVAGITPALCKWSGHSSTRQLERTYAHALPAQLRELTEALDQVAAANDNAGGAKP